MFSCKKFLGILGVGVLALTLSLSLATQAQALTIYVNSLNGAYRDPGPATRAANRLIASDPDTPVKTITNASQLASPYDTIEVAPGTYTEANISEKSQLKIYGKPGSAKPIIKPGSGNDYSAVKIDGSDHIEFTGFEIDGSTGGPNMFGITISPRTTSSVVTPSLHIKVAYNVVHDTGGGGIVAIPNVSSYVEDDTSAPNVYGCDYITITGNEIYGCLKTGRNAGSAISLLMIENYDGTTGTHNTIQMNRIHDNVINANNTGPQTDGNGIIIDLSGPNGPRTVVQNNLIYRNGGRGIHIFNSSNVDVLNNTVVKNCIAPGLFSDARAAGDIGEITVVAYVEENNLIRTKNVNVVNNLCTANSGKPCLIARNYGKYAKIPGTNTDDKTKWRIDNVDSTVKFYYDSYNTSYSFVTKPGTTPPVTGTNLFQITNPLFVGESAGNFKLNTGSVAIDKGTMTRYAFSTFDGVTRPIGAGVDLGAYERAK